MTKKEKSGDKVKESDRVSIRLTPQRKVKLFKLAERRGGVGKLIRDWIDNSSERCADQVAVKDGAAAHAMSWHLSRIGNSLNQMAYVANRASLSGKVNDKLIKEMAKELMYLNIKINILVDKCDGDKKEN
ncbi:MAG: hypothetical protein PHO62_07975 [Sulfurimonas sp.]|uniref:plasmid mobilization relaxosome protein MobC n=1 Tax=Sulfurimonas sp. TaxID=2022749 RepID=UPI002607DA21|nr:hypothetical protein [Sulfurimonas sp.]MDD5373345.1 hypothetical protein [Sulfurimonas sp.]